MFDPDEQVGDHQWWAMWRRDRTPDMDICYLYFENLNDIVKRNTIIRNRAIDADWIITPANQINPRIFRMSFVYKYGFSSFRRTGALEPEDMPDDAYR